MLSLLKSDQQRQRQVETPSSCIEVENDRNNEAEEEEEVDTRESESNQDMPSFDKHMTTSIATSNTSFNISADHKQSLSVDDGHWALLLNEVGRILF